MEEETKILVKRTKEEQKKEILKGTILISLFFLSLLGITTIFSVFNLLASCNGIYSCILKGIGVIGATLLYIMAVIFVAYILSISMTSKYKEIKKELKSKK